MVVLPDGEHIFPRDDDVVVSQWVAKQVSTRDKPAVYDGGWWLYDDVQGSWIPAAHEEVMRTFIAQVSGMKVFTSKDQQTGEIKSKKLNVKMSRLDGIDKLVKIYLKQQNFFDGASAGLCFKNGFVTVGGDGIKVAPHDPKHRSRVTLPYAYREEGCPRWMDFLRQVFLHDDDAAEKIMFLQDFLGTALIGEATNRQQALILFGEGSNGKSILLDVIQRCFPARNISSVPPQKWDEEYYRARLSGVVLNVVGELPQRDIVDTPALKDVIGGDMIEARRPGENSFSFRPKAAHVFAVNPPLPSVGDLSRGFWRRFVIMQMNRNFEHDPIKRDKNVYTEELVAEVAGIVYWALQGALRVKQANRYTPLPSSIDVLNMWRTSSDAVAQFCQDRCDPVGLDLIENMWTGDQLYNSYRAWSTSTGHTRMLSRSRFGERLSLLGHRPVIVSGLEHRPLRVTENKRIAPPAAQVAVPAGPAQPELASWL